MEGKESLIEARAELIVHWLDAYLNRCELVAKSTEGWFTSADIDDARRELVEAIKTAMSE